MSTYQRVPITSIKITVMSESGGRFFNQNIARPFLKPGWLHILPHDNSPPCYFYFMGTLSCKCYIHCIACASATFF